MDLLKNEQQLIQFSSIDRKICGLVTTTLEKTIFELNCLFCSEVFENLAQFIVHITSKKDCKDNLNDSESNGTSQPAIIIPFPTKTLDTHDEQEEYDYYVESDYMQEDYDDTMFLKQEETPYPTEDNTEPDDSINSTEAISIGTECFEEMKNEKNSGTSSDGYCDDRMDDERNNQKSNMPNFELVKVSLDLETSSDSEYFESFFENEPAGKNSMEIEKIKKLIEIYRMHPVLWNQKEPDYKNSQARKRAYYQIAEVMKEKFGNQTTAERVKRKIGSLRSKFRREAYEVITKKRPTDLWFYDMLSFIATDQDILKDKKSINSLQLEKFTETDTIDSCISEAKENNLEKILLPPEKIEQIEYLIDIYKEHPILWDKQLPHEGSVVKNHAYIQIAKAMTEKFNEEFTAQGVKQRILRLRTKFKRELLYMVKFKRKTPNLWFFDRLSYITVNEVIDESAKRDSIDLPLNTHPINLNSLQEFEENMQINSEFIKMYENLPCLWDEEHKDYNDEEKRIKAQDLLIESMKEKCNVDLTRKLLVRKIAIMKFLYKEEKRKNKSNKKEIAWKEPWYYSKLLFLEKTMPRKYECDLCKMVLTSENMFKNHLYKKHSIKSFFCGICKQNFCSRAALCGHSKTHADFKERPHVCKTCGAKFAAKGNLSVHERRHTKNCLHSCTLCENAYVTSTELKTHMRNHFGEKPYICDECGKTYRTSSALTQHRKTHAKSRDFKCNMCPKSFYDPNKLRDHIKSHSNIRDHICEVCGKGFKLRKTLRQHKQLHSDRKTYSCKICKRCFAQKAGLTMHLRRHGVMSISTSNDLLEKSLELKT